MDKPSGFQDWSIILISAAGTRHSTKGEETRRTVGLSTEKAGYPQIVIIMSPEIHNRVITERR
jgi:hypothetical protein